jgi:hypothetical protein
MSRRTRPTTKTRAAERREAKTSPREDRAPTSEEERLAQLHDVDTAVAEHVQEMLERGAKQAGEGRIP